MFNTFKYTRLHLARVQKPRISSLRWYFPYWAMFRPLLWSIEDMECRPLAFTLHGVRARCVIYIVIYVCTLLFASTLLLRRGMIYTATEKWIALPLNQSMEFISSQWVRISTIGESGMILFTSEPLLNFKAVVSVFWFAWQPFHIHVTTHVWAINLYSFSFFRAVCAQNIDGKNWTLCQYMEKDGTIGR